MASISIPTNGEPTSPEKKAWVGAGFGTLAAFVATYFVPAVILGSPLLGVVAAAAVYATGAATGYLMGKQSGEQQQEKELVEGTKEVKIPSFWNAKLAKTYAMSVLTYTGLGLGIAALAVGGFLASTPATGAAAIVMGGTFVASIGAMIYKGFQGKGEMEAEYTHAAVVSELEQRKQVDGVAKTRITVEPFIDQEQKNTRWQDEMAARRAAAMTLTHG